MIGRLIASETLERSLRYFIASVLLLTGLGKLLDVPGFIKVIETYQIIPVFMQPVIAVTLVVTELKIAENLFRKINLKLTALAATGLHVGFTFLATITLVRGIDVPNCGCFGVFWARPLTYVTVLEDIFMVGVCVFLYNILRRKESQI